MTEIMQKVQDTAMDDILKQFSVECNYYELENVTDISKEILSVPCI